ncbi:MAG: S8 family serine peptidase [Pseudomonadaceae bacterium]|nr:S8 family serine peptidase [Pseudomonadaceae bacterium]
MTGYAWAGLAYKLRNAAQHNNFKRGILGSYLYAPGTMTAYITRLALLGLMPILLGACGGGGGGGSRSAPSVPPANVAPQASFTLSEVSGTAPLVITADASDSSDSDGAIESYTWSFAGNPGIGPVAQFTFENSGSFDVQLTIVDDDGASATATRTVTVSDSLDTYTLRGTVRISNATAVDSDVNDRLTNPVTNNSFATAQNLPAPVTLGGFANVAGRGEATGNFFNSGDKDDFYQLDLNGNETVILTIADAGTDLDLVLWDEQRQLVDASLGTSTASGNFEIVEVPDAGRYFIQVFAVNGASNYVLTIGQNPAGNALMQDARRLTDPFVPGELILKHSPKQIRPKGGFRTLERQTSEGDRILAPGLFVPEFAMLKAQMPAKGKISADLRRRWQTLMALKQARQNEDIRSAELNLIAQPHATPDDSFFDSQWHYPAINLPLAWDTTTGSPDVIVAVVDSGVLLDHPDLNGQLVAGYDFVSDSTRARDGDGIDANPDDPGDREFGGSSSFHGTHVAGTIGAATDNDTGIAGVGWQTRIMPMRALGEGGGSTFDIVQAVRFAAGLPNNSGTTPARRADIINLSLGSSFSSPSEQEAYTAAIQAGVIIIASAGNDASDLPSYPAAYDGVIGVSATTITNEIASYSNFGSSVDVAAPGGSNITDFNGDGIGDGVISTIGDDSSGGPIEFGYLSQFGTSMAAPHVAGVAALMKAIYPALSPAEFNAALTAGELTDDLGEPGRDDRYGYGLINAQKAVITATLLANGQGVDPGPILAASASTLNFGSLSNNLSVTLQNVGTGSLTITGVSANAPWVTIIPPPTGSGLGEYRININRSALIDGAYQATVTFGSSANQVQVTLIMQVSSMGTTADAGLLYIILVNQEGETVVPARLVTTTDGTYPFAINNVPAGQYRIFAGTDADDDAVLCDAGESCGALATLDSPTVLAVNENLQDLDFEASFRVNLNTSGIQGQVSESAPTRDDNTVNFSKQNVVMQP